MILTMKISEQTRQRGHTLSTCTVLTQALDNLYSPPLVPCCSLDYQGWQLLNQPFLVYVFSSFDRSLPRFRHDVYNSCAVSCASSPLFRPPRSHLRSRPRSYPRPRSYLNYCSRFRPRSRPRSHPVYVDGSLAPSPLPFPPCPRAGPRSHLALLRLHVPPFPFPLRTFPSPFTSPFPRPTSTPFPSPFPSPTAMCVCVTVCVFIKLHITAQSGPVILVILCHSN